MPASLYLTSAEGRTGKSAVALGVLDALLAQAPRVGVFRPLIRSGEEPDRVLELLLSRATADLSYDQCVGVTYELANDDPRRAMREIVAAYRAMLAHCDAVLIVGSDYTDVAAPTELAYNARIAANLDAPVMLILGGRAVNGGETLGQSKARSAAEIAQLAEISAREVQASHAALLSVIVNRADPDALGTIEASITESLPEGVQVGVLPEDVSLVAPSVAAVLAAVDGELARGSADMLGTAVERIVIAGMAMEHVLPRLFEGAVVVIAADRADVLLAVAMAHEAPAFPSLAAIVLNGDFEVSPDVERLLDELGSRLPVIRTSLGTFDTATAVTAARGELSLETPQQIDSVIGAFRQRINGAELRHSLSVHAGGVRTPTMFTHDLFERASAAGARIVLPEGRDERVLRAAAAILAQGIAEITLLGDPEVLRAEAARLGVALDRAEVVDPLTSPLREEFAHEYVRVRAHAGLRYAAALDELADVNVFGTLMVHLGHADGMVSGAAHPTAQTIRPALQIIRTRPGVSLVSSVFFMALADRVLVYGDCAVNPQPTPEQLADIALSSADTAALFGVEPRVAMLSYSTGESGGGDDVTRVREATRIAQAARPELLLEGPMQYDAASDAEVGAMKMPNSEVAGRATVFIFPDLNTGNNTYKAVQRSAGALAIGPVLQGLNKPINDLSRGATIDDIVSTVAITAVQAGEQRAGASAAESRADVQADEQRAGVSASTGGSAL